MARDYTSIFVCFCCEFWIVLYLSIISKSVMGHSLFAINTVIAPAAFRFFEKLKNGIQIDNIRN